MLELAVGSTSDAKSSIVIRTRLIPPSSWSLGRILNNMPKQTIISFRTKASLLEVLADTDFLLYSGVQEVASVVALLAVTSKPINADVLLSLVIISFLVQRLVYFLQLFDAFVVQAVGSAVC